MYFGQQFVNLVCQSLIAFKGDRLPAVSMLVIWDRKNLSEVFGG